MKSKQTKEFNDIKEALRISFPKRHCFTFRKPIEDEKIAELDSIPDSQLNSEFLAKADAFCGSVLDQGDIFRVGDADINGPRMCYMLFNYNMCIC